MVKNYLPPLKSLQFFNVAAQQQSFKQAAAQLNVTQAAVSQQIKLLEGYLDLQLFERNNRSTKLTAAGAKLLPFIKNGFEQFHAGIQHVSGDVDPDVLRISAFHSFTSLWLLPKLQTFQNLYPDLMVQIAPCNELTDFNRGDVDIAIRMGSGNYPGLTTKALVKDQLIVVAGSKLVDDSNKDSAEHVFALPWLEDISDDIAPIFDNLCSTYGIDKNQIKSVIRSDNSIILIDNALASRGVVIVNKSLVAEHLHSGELIPLLGFSQPSPYALYLVAPEQHFQWKKVKAFENWFTPLIQQSSDYLD